MRKEPGLEFLQVPPHHIWANTSPWATAAYGRHLNFNSKKHVLSIITVVVIIINYYYYFQAFLHHKDGKCCPKPCCSPPGVIRTVQGGGQASCPGANLSALPALGCCSTIRGLTRSAADRSFSGAQQIPFGV